MEHHKILTKLMIAAAFVDSEDRIFFANTKKNFEVANNFSDKWTIDEETLEYVAVTFYDDRVGLAKGLVNALIADGERLRELPY
jgi:hypothetical protein